MSTEAIGLNAANHYIGNAAAVTRLAVLKPLTEAKNTNETVANANSEDDGAPLAHALEELNRYVAGSRTDLRFSVDRDAGQVVVSIIDSESGQLLRQLPSAEAIRIARYIEHNRLGLIRQRA